MRIIKLFFEAYKEWVRDRGQGLAAALAYYQVLMLGPLIAFLLFISQAILGYQTTINQTVPILKNWFTPPFVNLIIFLLKNIDHMEVEDLVKLSLIPALVLAYATKEYFGQIRDVVEITWNERREKYGFIEALKRLWEDLQILAVSIVIITIYLFLRVLLPHPFIGEGNIFPENRILILIPQAALEFLLFFVLYMYYFISVPRFKIYWKNALPGAILGAVLYEIGRAFLRAYMYEHPVIEIAESFVVILVWLYYVNIAFVYAAEFNKLFVADKQKIDVSLL